MTGSTAQVAFRDSFGHPEADGLGEGRVDLKDQDGRNQQRQNEMNGGSHQVDPSLQRALALELDDDVGQVGTEIGMARGTD